MHIRFVSLVLLFVGIVALIVFQATRESTAVVLVPSDLVAKGSAADLPRIRVGGRVADDAIAYQTSPEMVLKFTMQDRPDDAKTVAGDTKVNVPVVFRGLKPDMFAVGRDIIVDGEFKDGTLVANRVLTQCPSKYEPPSPVKKAE